MNTLVKILSDDDGTIIENPAWCFSTMHGGEPVSLCRGICYGEGETIGKSLTKTVKRGGITCPNCVKIIKEFKEITL